MLLEHDDGVLPESESARERDFLASLREAERLAIDSRILDCARTRWLKVARVVWDAMTAGDYDPWDDEHVVHVHVRAVARLVGAGKLHAQGDLRRPRFSEVRRSTASTSDAADRADASRRYFARRWDDSRGDEQDEWGGSWWYFECDAAGTILRQVEDYDAGPTLRYDAAQPEGRYGGLADQALDLAEMASYETRAEVFEQVWARAVFVPG